MPRWGRPLSHFFWTRPDSQTTLRSSGPPPDSTVLPCLILNHMLPARMTQDLGMTDGLLMSPAVEIRNTVRGVLT